MTAHTASSSKNSSCPPTTSIFRDDSYPQALGSEDVAIQRVRDPGVARKRKKCPTPCALRTALFRSSDNSSPARPNFTKRMIPLALLKNDHSYRRLLARKLPAISVSRPQYPRATANRDKSSASCPSDSTVLDWEDPGVIVVPVVATKPILATSATRGLARLKPASCRGGQRRTLPACFRLL